MKLKITKEELKAIQTYKNETYKLINHILAEQVENDLSFMMQNSQLQYSKTILEETIETIGLMISAMIKTFQQKDKAKNLMVYKQVSLSEAEQLKLDFSMNSFCLAKTEKEIVENTSTKASAKVVNLELKLDSAIPYMELEKNEILIFPFTHITNLKEKKDNFYQIDLALQEWEILSDEERTNLSENVRKQADEIGQKIKDCIELDQETVFQYENIRKLEQLLAKHNFAIEQETYQQDTTPEERQSDLEDIERITTELTSLKDKVAQLFNSRQQNIDTILDWKRDLAAYIKNEIRLIYGKYSAPTNVTKPLQEKTEQTAETEKKELPPEVEDVKKEALENLAVVDTLLKNIQDLIAKQQNHARIAEAMDSNYKALNNAFEMKNVAEELEALVQAISSKIDTMLPENKEELDKISEVNLQVNILLNYLNNAKAAVGKKINRFDEMAIIEENELKKEIAETIKNIRCEAELKKLEDDVEIIEDKNKFQRFIGRFTGKNKLDATMLDQIKIRQTAIKKTFKAKMLLSYNYSIHELLAEIEMFIKENEDDELVLEDVSHLRKIKDILKKNFVIADSKVNRIIEQKMGKNLPVVAQKISKKELIEIDTYRFLNRYGYDRSNDRKEPEYQDTLANEIKRIVEYIKTSGVI